MSGRSSRSHTIFTLTIESRLGDEESGDGTVRVASLVYSEIIYPIMMSFLVIINIILCIIYYYRKRKKYLRYIEYGDLAIEHKITKLKTANILAHMHYIIVMGCTTAKLKIRQYFIISVF